MDFNVLQSDKKLVGASFQVQGSLIRNCNLQFVSESFEVVFSHLDFSLELGIWHMVRMPVLVLPLHLVECSPARRLLRFLSEVRILTELP